MTFQQAVFSILDSHGDQLSAERLMNLVAGKCGEFPSLGTVYSYRSKWRQQSDSDTDCRTNKGQPERNMDRVAERKAENKLFEICETYGVPFGDVKQLAILFESIKLQDTCERAEKFSALVAA